MGLVSYTDLCIPLQFLPFFMKQSLHFLNRNENSHLLCKVERGFHKDAPDCVGCNCSNRCSPKGFGVTPVPVAVLAADIARLLTLLGFVNGSSYTRVVRTQALFSRRRIQGNIIQVMSVV